MQTMTPPAASFPTGRNREAARGRSARDDDRVDAALELAHIVGRRLDRDRPVGRDRVHQSAPGAKLDRETRCCDVGLRKQDTHALERAEAGSDLLRGETIGDERRFDSERSHRLGGRRADRGHPRGFGQRLPPEPLAHAGHAVRAREHDPAVALEPRKRGVERSCILDRLDVDERHREHRRTESLECLGERADSGLVGG